MDGKSGTSRIATALCAVIALVAAAWSSAAPPTAALAMVSEVLKPSSSPAAAARTTPLRQIGGTVTVLAVWGGSEQESFMAMVSPFQEQTGVQVLYEGTRDINAVLTTRVQAGNPPDVAGLPGPGQMAELAHAGRLVDLGSAIDLAAMRRDYAEDWIRLGTVDGKLVGVFIKAALKGPIWYNPRQFAAVSGGAFPKTWDELMALSEGIAASGVTPWCIGLESGAASGWPGTDWIENIVLRQTGPAAYDRWTAGELEWTSPEIRTAWQSWGQIVGNPKMVFGGAPYILSANFGDAGTPLFTSPPGCYLHHQGSFITDFFVKANPNLKPIEDFNFFPFPDVSPQYPGATVVGGDLFGMFRDTPQARALMSYLITPEAQSIWVKRGGALSPNRRVPPETYPDPISRQQAETLTTAQTVRFDGSDLMPEALNNAFLRNVLEFVQNPGNLDTYLADLDRVSRESYQR